MSIENGIAKHELLKPFKYHDKDRGGDVDATFIELREPDYFHSKQSFAIQQMVTRLMMEIQQMQSQQPTYGEEVKPLHEVSEQIESESDALAEAISVGLMMSKEVDAGEFVEKWVEMACNTSARKNIAMIDGKYALRQVHIEQMSPDDVLGSAVRWAAFFGMPAQMRGLVSGEQSE